MPNNWKKGEVVAMHKKINQQKCKSYRGAKSIISDNQCGLWRINLQWMRFI